MKAVATALLLLTACSSAQLTESQSLVDPARIPSDVPVALHRAYWPIVSGDDRDLVLNRLNFAGQAIHSGAFAPAKRQLDLALDDILSVFSNRENAQKALRLWHEEGMKDFKGEPYERSMAFFYRGLLYALDGEFDNARASFEAGFQQDTVAMDSETIADFALLLYLKAWATGHMDDPELLSADAEEYRRFNQEWPAPGNRERLVIVETGSSPRKVADGVGHYELVYRRGHGYQPETLKLARASRQLYLMEDIYWQATSRGPRAIDRIIQGQAQFMNRSLKAGLGLSAAGTVANRYSAVFAVFGADKAGTGAGYASDALNVASAISLLMASAANPRVDTRYWESMSDKVWVGRLGPGESLVNSQLELTYEDGFKYSHPASAAVVAMAPTLEWYRVPHRFRYRPPIIYNK